MSIYQYYKEEFLMSKKSKKMSETAKLLRQIREAQRGSKLKKRKIQCDCQHRSDNGKVYLRVKEDKNGNTYFRCKECHDTVDVSPVLDKSRDQVKKYIKKSCKSFANICNIAKLSINPRYDKKYRKIISKAQFMAYQVQKMAVIAIAEGFEPVKKKGKKGRKHGFNLSAGNTSFGR
jgi:hypothetical protein